MIEELVEKFDSKRDVIKDRIIAWNSTDFEDERSPTDAESLWKILIDEVFHTDDKSYTNMDYAGAVSIGDYSGDIVLIFIEYAEHDIYISRYGYGSCSGCDAIQDALGYDSVDVDKMFSILLHIFQCTIKL
ncbi:MAG: hypothetical protein ABL876_00060 [Chitinophagaceae bacterium]